MTLAEIRQKFVELSGRFDLVTDYVGADYSNNGADWFLDCGQRLLDRIALYTKAYAWYKTDISSGTTVINFRYCSVIKEVWYQTADGRKPIDKKDYDWMREEYADEHSSLSEGSPKYYCPLNVGLGPDQVTLTSSNYTDEFTYDHEEIMFSDEGVHHLYRGIMIMPPPDEAMTISIKGRFWSPPLYPNKSDSLHTYWTDVHPELLVLSAMYSLEGFYRNREGQADYMQQMMVRLDSAAMDVTEEENEDVDYVEG